MNPISHVLYSFSSFLITIPISPAEILLMCNIYDFMIYCFLSNGKFEGTHSLPSLVSFYVNVFGLSFFLLIAVRVVITQIIFYFSLCVDFPIKPLVLSLHLVNFRMPFIVLVCPVFFSNCLFIVFWCPLSIYYLNWTKPIFPFILRSCKFFNWSIYAQPIHLCYVRDLKIFVFCYYQVLIHLSFEPYCDFPQFSSTMSLIFKTLLQKIRILWTLILAIIFLFECNYLFNKYYSFLLLSLSSLRGFARQLISSLYISVFLP